MNRIILTEEQARQLNPLEPAEICDPAGRVLRELPPVVTAEELARVRRAKDYKGPWVSSEQVRRGLQALDAAWEKEGPFDMERAREIVRQARSS